MNNKNPKKDIDPLQNIKPRRIIGDIKLYGTGQLAELVGVDRRTIMRHLHNGELEKRLGIKSIIDPLNNKYYFYTEEAMRSAYNAYAVPILQAKTPAQ